MSFVRGFAAFWYDFIVGDSWELAAGVLALLAVAAAVDRIAPETADHVLFVVVPAAVVGTLGISLARAKG